MLAGNMGMGAYNKLSAHGITVIRGCQGKVDDVLKAYLNGELKDSLESCDHHDCDHHEEKPVYYVSSFGKKIITMKEEELWCSHKCPNHTSASS